MATRIQLRRGTTAQHSSFTGAVGEITVDTDKDTVVVHGDSKQGGYPLAKAEGLFLFDAGGNISAANLLTYKGYRIVIDGNYDITLPDATASEVGYTWVIHNAHSGAITLDKGTADQTVKHLTGSAVTTITVNSSTSVNIASGGVAELVCISADNYIIFGSGIS